jgi:hypothetical protein
MAGLRMRVEGTIRTAATHSQHLRDGIPYSQGKGTLLPGPGKFLSPTSFSFYSPPSQASTISSTWGPFLIHIFHNNSFHSGNP